MRSAPAYGVQPVEQASCGESFVHDSGRESFVHDSGREPFDTAPVGGRSYAIQAGMSLSPSGTAQVGENSIGPSGVYARQPAGAATMAVIPS